jgi:RecJ-like exonuclease
MKRFNLSITALALASVAVTPFVYGTPNFAGLRSNTQGQTAVDFDELRRENLDKDAVAVDFDELRRENLDKDLIAVDFDELRRENLDKDSVAVDFDELRRENLDKDVAIG